MALGPVHLHIADVLTAVPANAGVEAGMVMLTEDDAPYRSLRIIIGQPEANAIQAGWHGAVPGRPSTWDLFVSTVALLEGRIDRVVITAVHEERHYFAHIELEQAGERRILACRPSDALALAVRAYNVDILAEAAVLDAAGVLPDGSKPGQTPVEPTAEPALQLAEREAALASREADLAERERRLAARERETVAPVAETVRAGAEGAEPVATVAEGADGADPVTPVAERAEGAEPVATVAVAEPVAVAVAEPVAEPETLAPVAETRAPGAAATEPVLTEPPQDEPHGVAPS